MLYGGEVTTRSADPPPPVHYLQAVARVKAVQRGGHLLATRRAEFKPFCAGARPLAPRSAGVITAARSPAGMVPLKERAKPPAAGYARCSDPAAHARLPGSSTSWIVGDGGADRSAPCSRTVDLEQSI